jgi:hypothetical protein
VPNFDPFNSNQQPMFGGQPLPGGGGPFNLPQLGQLNLLLNLLTPSLMQMMGDGAYVPAQFMPMQGMADQMRANLFARQTMQVMQQASLHDVPAFRDLILYGGMGKIAGLDVNDPFRRTQAEIMAKDLAVFAPFGAMGMDAILGRGSFDALFARGQGTMPIAQSLFEAGQFRRDAMTGFWGARPETSVELAHQVRERLFGTPEAAAAMKGMTSTEAGDLFQELAIRGFAPPVTTRENLARQRGTSPEDISDLDLQSVNADQISNRLKSLSGVVSAMRDIFGDAGRPNAPMRELINGLQNLTQSGLATMTPQALEQSVRMTYNLARMSGVGIQNMMGLMSHGASMADQLGVDRSLAVQATQGAVAFGAAFGSAGGGDIPSFGALDREKLTLMDLRLRMQAAASPAANQLATIARLKAAGVIKEGTEAFRIATAVEQGQATYDGNKSIHMGTEQLRRIMQAGGVSNETFESALRQRPANEPYIQQFDIGSTVRQNFQGAELERDLARGYSDAIRGQLNASGQATKANLARARQLAEQAAHELMTTKDPAVRADRNVQREFMRKFFETHGTGLNIDFGAAEEVGFGAAEQMMRLNPALAGYRQLVNALRANDPAVLREQQAVRQSAAAESALQQAFAGMGTAGPLQRLSNVLMTNEISGEDALASILGAEKTAEVLNAPGSPVRAWIEQMQQAKEAERDPETGALTAKGQARVKELTRRANALFTGQGAEEIIRELRSKGPIGPEDMQLLAGLEQTLAPGGRGTVKGFLEGAGLDLGVDMDDPEKALTVLMAKMAANKEQVGKLSLRTAAGQKATKEALIKGEYEDVAGDTQKVKLKDAGLQQEAERIRELIVKQEAEKEKARTFKITLTSGKLTWADDGFKINGDGDMVPEAAGLGAG